MIDGELKEGDIVLVRFEIRRGQPSETGSFMASRALGGHCGSHARAYDWIPREAIECRAPPEK